MRGRHPLSPPMVETEVGSSHCLENSSAAKTAIVRCDFLPPIMNNPDKNKILNRLKKKYPKHTIAIKNVRKIDDKGTFSYDIHMHNKTSGFGGYDEGRKIKL